MKKAIARKLFLLSAVTLAVTGFSVPAHATLSGSNPRPTSGVLSTSQIVSVILTALGY